jgi:hypothetical protein
LRSPFSKHALSAIERWIYATSALFLFDPLPFEAVGLTRGRELKSEDKARIKYGLDHEGRIVYEWSGVPGCFQESFLRYEPGTVFRAAYDCTELKGQLFARFLVAAQLVLDRDGKAVSLQRGVGSSASRQSFIWEEGKLACVEISDSMGESMVELQYDALGELEKVWRGSGKNRQLYFKRPPRNANLPSLERVIAAELPAEIRSIVRRCKVKDPVYCLALAYDGEGNGPLPPCLGIGLESERRRWRQERAAEAKVHIWNPAEFAHYEKPHTQLQNRRLLRMMELYQTLLESKSASFSRAVKLLNQVAKQLATFDWSDSLNITDDFVVYCIDFELCTLSRNLRQSVPAERLGQLKERGYL